MAEGLEAGWLPRVLVVDDSTTRRVYFTDWFVDRGFKVKTAIDGQAAFDLLLQTPPAERPELVVSDVDMPRLNGIDMAARIRAEPMLEGIPVILYSTSSLDPRGEAAALKAGATDCVKGAIDVADLEILVEKRVKAMRSLRRLAEARALIGGTRPPPRPGDL